MGTGVAGAIKRKGGTVIEEDAVRQGPVEVGEAVLTVAGNLPATHVIHAATMGPDLKTDPSKIAAATRSSLALADKHRSPRSPSRPSGAGWEGSRRRVAPTPCSRPWSEHLKSGKSVVAEGVMFVLYQDEAQKAFTDTLKKADWVIVERSGSSLSPTARWPKQNSDSRLADVSETSWSRKD